MVADFGVTPESYAFVGLVALITCVISLLQAITAKGEKLSVFRFVPAVLSGAIVLYMVVGLFNFAVQNQHP